MDVLISASAAELARRIRARELSSVEAVTACLRRIEQINDTLNAVVTRCDEVALQRAQAADAALARGEKAGERAGQRLGPLHGVPITVKDAFDTAGVRSTGGTEGRAHCVPTTNATAVERLLAAGAILVGKTNTPELTLAYDTDNLLFGKTRNPYDLSRSPGGSSGGSAAIVAAGGAPLDLGSDTGGSIRLPAHFCGVAGLKPTAGRVPRTGLILPGGTPVDALTEVGPIARYVEDLTLVLPIVSGVDGKDPSVIPMPPADDPAAVGLTELRAAFYTDNGDVPASPEVAAVVRACADVLAERVARVRADRPPGIERARALFERLLTTDGSAWVRRALARAGTTTPHSSLRWADPDKGAPEAAASEFSALGEELDAFRRDMLGFVQRYDVILAPAHAWAALPHGELTSPQRSPAFSYTQGYNLAGWPGAVVRAGTSPEGLPIGVQIVARPWREDVALAVARCIEDALGGWRPPSLEPFV